MIRSLEDIVVIRPLVIVYHISLLYGCSPTFTKISLITHWFGCCSVHLLSQQLPTLLIKKITVNLYPFKIYFFKHRDHSRIISSNRVNICWAQALLLPTRFVLISESVTSP